MPIYRLKEISGMSTEDRTQKLGELRAELSRMRTMIHAGGAIENPTRVRELRKTIAQILTIENEYRKGIRKSNTKETKAEPKKTKAAPSKKPQEKKPE
jgi:large subunit ribosomal protein L29